MSFGFSSFGHFIARMAKDAVHISKAIIPALDKAAAEAEKLKVPIEAVTAGIAASLGLPPGIPIAIEDAAYSLLGRVTEASHAAGDAIGANGLNVNFDQELIKDIKALTPAIQAFAISRGITAPPLPLNPATSPTPGTATTATVTQTGTDASAG